MNEEEREEVNKHGNPNKRTKSTHTHTKDGKKQRGGGERKKGWLTQFVPFMYMNTDICSKYCACSSNDPLREVYKKEKH